MENAQSQPESGDHVSADSIAELAARVTRIERYLRLATAPSTPPVAATETLFEEEAERPDDTEFESRFGEFGLAWLGSAILGLGIVFLMAYTQGQGYPLLAAVIGYGAAAGLFALSVYWRGSLVYLSQMMVGSCLLLLFYTTLRLGFFTSSPVVDAPLLVLGLMLGVVALQFALSVLRRSQAFGAIGVILALVSALVVDRTHLTLALIAITAGIATYLSIRYEWRPLLVATMVLTYVAHVLWLFGDPVAGHAVGAVAAHQYNLAYVFAYAAIFFLPTFLEKDEDEIRSVFVVLLNVTAFMIVGSLIVLTHYRAEFAALYLAIAAFWLAGAIAQWLKTHDEFTPAIYAGAGYMALSVAIFGYTERPSSFLLLSLQAMLVVSMSLWFRSRTLVVLNALIFVGILLAYLATSPSSNWVNFSFALVAIASARVMNWQKERLTLQTDMLRNVYLVISVLLTLYAFYKLVPSEYVALSWTATAVFYFVVSYVLKNVKYRRMAVATVLATVLYLLLVDLSRLDPRFRVPAFLSLGVLALGFSLFYARTRLRRRSGHEEPHFSV